MELVAASEDVRDLSESTEDDRFSFHKNLLDSLFDGVYFGDTERKITYWNQGAENLTGYSASESVGRSCYDNFLAHVDGQGCALCAGGCPLSKTIEDGQRRKADVFLRHKLGHRVPVCVRVAPIKSKSAKSWEQWKCSATSPPKNRRRGASGNWKAWPFWTA